MKRVTSRWANPAEAIVGIVFTSMGAVFLVLGLSLGFGLRAQMQDWEAFVWTFGMIGAVFLVIGLVCLMDQSRKRRRIERLIARGCYVTAHLVGVQPNFSVQVNGRCGYEALCRYCDEDGTVHLFKSDLLWVDPTPFLKDDEVKVYVDGGNLERYHVAMEEALRAVRVH